MASGTGDDNARLTAEAAAADPEGFAHQAAGVSLYLLVQELSATGMRRGNAFRLAAALLIEETMGLQGLRDCGVPESTMWRWKAEARERGVNVEPQPAQPPAELVDRVSRLLAGLPVPPKD